ncbi:hypothetical protein WG899_12065 [Paucibacter sp. AS339]|uniref:hypothetical protein n=1 Tax=Paucibacter hankyongi TaxID=3133434 RepID=UPI0030B48735
MTASITKREAITTVSQAFNLSLANATTHFANVNASKSVWWFDIPVEKFTSGRYEALDLLLVSSDSTSIHHLRVPTAYVRDNLAKFHIRDDKGSVSLELSSRVSQLFQDVRPGSEKLSFSQFLLNTLPL